MINVSNNYKQALTQPRTIDAKITYDSTTINIDDINSIKRSFNSTLFKTIAKQVIIDSNVSINKDITINPQFGIYIDTSFEYVSLGSYKVKNAPNLNKDTNSYEITAYDKIVDSMVDYGLTESDITYPCSVRQLFVAIFTKLGWTTSGIPATFVNSTSMIEEDVYSNVNFTYRDVLDELCTISCMFLIDVNGTPTLKQKTTTSETINEDFMSDTNVQIKNQVFFNSLVFSRASNSDNIYRKDDTSITNNGLHEFKVSDLQILSLNWRDNFIDAMWNYIKTFNYYAYEVNTNGITYLEPIDTFTLSTFGSTYSTILLNSDLTISNGVNEKIYANEPLESETEYKYADTTDKRINQTNLIVDKQNGKIDAVVSQVDEVEQDLSNPTNNLTGQYFDIDNALDEPLVDFSMEGQTEQDSTTGKNKLNLNSFATTTISGITLTPTFENGLLQYITSSGTYSGTPTYITLINTQDISASTQYILSGAYSGSARLRLREFDSNNTQLSEYFDTGSGVSFTTKANVDHIIVQCVFYAQNNVKFYPMIRLSSIIDNTYEPYTNGPAPNPDYPMDIHCVSGDNTIEICGKNRFYSTLVQGVVTNTFIETNIYRVASNQFIKLKANTQYTISYETSVGINNINISYFATNNFPRASEGGWQTVSTSNNRRYLTFTTSTNQYVLFSFRKSTNASISTTDITNIQLEEGNQSSEYEPYTGNSQLISLGVENLFDKDNANKLTGAFVDASNHKIGSNANATSIYIPIMPNTTYCVSKTKGNRFAIGYCSTTPATNVALTNIVDDRTKTILTSKSASDSKYLVVYISLSDTETYENIIATLQIEKGSKANSYSEYGKTPIELNKISTYQDYIYKDNDRWFLHKEIGKKVFNGSENWSYSSGSTQPFRVVIDNIKSITQYEAPLILTNYFTNFIWGASTKPDYGITHNATTIAIRNKDNLTDLATFKTWLSTHNTIVYYVLAEATDTEITDEVLLGQLNNLMTLPLYKNMTHITLTPNDLQPTMKIEYYRDTSINNNYLPREEITKYYTKTETNSQIEISNSSIKSDVAEIQTTLDDNGNTINIISNQVQTLQTSTNLQINAINETLENGVEKVTNSLVRIDANGINTSKTGETFNTQITNRTFEVRNSTDANVPALVFVGYDTNENRTVARIPELESRQATIGVHRTEILYEDNEYWTADFYVGGGN